MKTKTITVCLSVFMVLLIGIIAPAALEAASARATVSVKVVRHIAIANTSPMSFGYVSAGAAAGSVVLRQDGTRNPTGGVVVEAGGSPTPASFTVAGEPNAGFAISLPNSVVMTDSDGNTLTVDNFSNTIGETGIFDGSGHHELKVGATLHVGPNQALGDYHGSMDISINYN